MRALLFVTASAVLFASPACVASTEPTGGGSSSAPPAVQGLFDNLEPATPDRLRGVWSITTANSNGDADLRMRFEEGNLTVGTRCSAKAAPGDPVLVGSSAAITTTDLDGASGIFELGETINVTETRGGITCSGRFDKATWSFTISGTGLDMDPLGQQGHVHLEKVGD